MDTVTLRALAAEILADPLTGLYDPEHQIAEAIPILLDELDALRTVQGAHDAVFASMQSELDRLRTMCFTVTEADIERAAEAIYELDPLVLEMPYDTGVAKAEVPWSDLYEDRANTHREQARAALAAKETTNDRHFRAGYCGEAARQSLV
jgi:hypothetical protein